MNYQNQCSCQDTTARTGCGCGSNSWHTPRSTDCGCGSNTWRTPRSTNCGCGSNTERVSGASDCGCGSSVAETCQNSTNYSQRNAGTVWKNRSACCPAVATPYTVSRNLNCACQKETVARNLPCNDTPCAIGASDDCALSGRSLAMVYSPHQEFQSLYDPREGLCRGTVFCELDKPFYGSGRGC